MYDHICHTVKSRLSEKQRQIIPDLIVQALKQNGRTISNLGGDFAEGDAVQRVYADKPVWLKKKDLDALIADRLQLPQPLGQTSKRLWLDFKTRTARELIKFRKKGIITDWSTSKRTSIIRLADASIKITVPKMSIESTVSDGEDEQSMKSVFLHIISKSKKDNTYKFALGKTLLDYCRYNAPTGQASIIKYDYLASSPQPPPRRISCPSAGLCIEAVFCTGSFEAHFLTDFAR